MTAKRLSAFSLVSHRELQPTILWSSLTLLMIGVVMVTSASLHEAAATTGSPFYFGLHQGVYLLLGLVVAALVYLLVPSIWLKNLRLLAVLAAFGALLVVLLPGIGIAVNGSRRWINLGLFTVQASEVVKLCFVVYLAGYIDVNRQALQQGWQAFVGPLILFMLLALFLLLEPNFGAVVVLGICTMGMLLMAGVKKRYFAVLIVAGALAGGLLIVAEPYRMERLMSFMDPWSDRFGSGYQLTQSLIAFGRGHWLGVGLGEGVQKLSYLPEAHTDFVFAVLGEELGLAGVCCVIALFCLLGYSLLQQAWRLLEAGAAHRAMLVFGFAMIICSQVFINMGVTMGILPTKGLTLPLISYGGSSLVITLVMLAVVLRCVAEPLPDAAAEQGGGK